MLQSVLKVKMGRTDDTHRWNNSNDRKVTTETSPAFNFSQPTEIETSQNIVIPNFTNYAFALPTLVVENIEANFNEKKAVSIFGGITSFSGIKKCLEDQQSSIFGGSAEKENEHNCKHNKIKVQPLFEKSNCQIDDKSPEHDNHESNETNKETETSGAAVEDIFGEIPLENRASPSMFKKHSFTVDDETIYSARPAKKKKARVRKRTAGDSDDMHSDTQDDGQRNQDPAIQTSVKRVDDMKKVALDNIMVKIIKLESENGKIKEEDVIKTETINNLLLKLQRKDQELDKLLEEKKLLKICLEEEKLKDRSNGDDTDLTSEIKRLREELDKTKSLLETEQSRAKTLEMKQAKLRLLVLDAEQKLMK